VAVRHRAQRRRPRLAARSGRFSGIPSTFPAHAGDAVAFAVANRRYRLRDLPGVLDEAGRLALGRRLIREGLVSILPGP